MLLLEFGTLRVVSLMLLLCGIACSSLGHFK
jgi:hypothetical protein